MAWATGGIPPVGSIDQGAGTTANFPFSGAIELCLRVAGRRLTGNLAAPIVSRRRSESLDVCLHWLSGWLPRPGRGESSSYILIASPLLCREPDRACRTVIVPAVTYMSQEKHVLEY